MEDTAELKIILRSLLISNPKVMKANRLEIEFNESQGRPFPYRKLGFQSFLDYLKSIPLVVQLVPYNSNNPDVHPFVTKESSHIDKLVSKQKISSQKKSISQSSRRGGYHGRFSRQSGPTLPRRRPPCNLIPLSQPTPLSRTTSNKVPSTFDPDFVKKILWELVKKVAGSKNGIDVKDLENHLMKSYRREDLVKNGIHTARDVLYHANDMVNCVDDKIFPKIPSSDLKASSYMSNSNYNSDNYNGNCIPAGSEEAYGYTNCDYENNEFWETVSEEEISNYTIGRCSQSALEPQRSDSPLMRHEAEKKCNPGDTLESNISEVMINNFKKILAKHPDGIWATELPQKYFEEFKVTLDVMDLGYNSVIRMAADLPNVFTYERAGSHDWKLRSFNEDSSNHSTVKEDDFSEFSFERESYVPQSILSNIKSLIEQHPSGIRSTSLHYLYEAHFNKTLDLKTLGFNQIEEFLEVLKKVVTLRKVTDYYLLLPKHTVLPLETVQSHAPDEVLTIPDEPFSFLGPDNVLRPGETIPIQELPPVNIHAKPEEALMELEVRVGEVISPGLFYIILDSKYNDLQSMMDDLDKFYKQEEKHYQIRLPNLVLNLYCVCKYDDSWHRAKITGFQTNDLIEIEYIDYGTPGKVKKTELRLLQNDFAKLPAQAICAKLIGIKPRNNERKWPREVSKTFLDLVTEVRLFAYVYKVGIHINKERVQLEVILFNTMQGEIIINERLVELKLAQFVNQAEPVSEDKTRFVKEEDTSIAGHLPLNSGQADNHKQLRPPPGFEPLSTDKPNDPVPSLPSMYTAQVQAAGYFPSCYTHPQHVQVNNYFPLTTFISSNGNILPGPNSLLQNEIGSLSLPQLGVQANNLYNNAWKSHVAFPPPFGFITPLPAPLPSSFYIPQAPETKASPQFTNLDTNQTNSNVSKLFSNNNSRQFTNHETSQNPIRKSDIIPGKSSDLSLPQQTINTLSQPILHEFSSALTQEEINNLPNNSEVISGSSPVGDENDKEPIGISRPSSPLSPSSVKEIDFINSSRFSSESSSTSNLSIQYSEKNNKGKLFQKDMCKVTNDNVLESESSNILSLRRPSSTSDEYDSATENVTDIKQSKACITDTFGNYTNEKIPDSWEDIQPDDTPAKAEHFSQDFKAPLDLIINEDDFHVKINQFPDITLKTAFSSTEIKQLPINWKDGFDPDIIGNSRSCPEKLMKSPTNTEKIKRGCLVQELEIEKKCFHLIFVNNKPAVLSNEFYPKFTSLQFSVIKKIVEVKCEALFTTICKGDEPALFSALEKVEFCGGVNKKSIIKFGKADVSYLSDVPEVFSMLNLQNKLLLDKIKKISSEFHSS